MTLRQQQKVKHALYEALYEHTKGDGCLEKFNKAFNLNFRTAEEAAMHQVDCLIAEWGGNPSLEEVHSLLEKIIGKTAALVLMKLVCDERF